LESPHLSKRERLSNYIKPRKKDHGETENETVVSTLYLEGTRLKTQPANLRKSRRRKHVVMLNIYYFPSRKTQVENFPPRTSLSTGHTVTQNQLIASTDIFIAQVKRFHFTFKVAGRIYRQLT